MAIPNKLTEAFAVMMKKSEPLFRLFTVSGVFILIGILVIIIAAMRMIVEKPGISRPAEKAELLELV